MKKILLALSAVALLFATSCKKENINPAVDVPEGSFLATIDNGANPQNAPRINDGMGTMTTIDDQRYVIWENGDQIKINGESYITNTTGSSVVFNPVDITKQATVTPFNAFYPASLVTAEGYRLPATQDIVLDDNNNITVRNLPMYATSTTNQLTFNNICAVLKVTIPEGVTNCNKLVLHADKNICGTFQMNGNVAELTDKTGSDNNTITVNAPQGNNFSNSNSVYVAIPAGTYTFSIELKNGDDKLFDSKTVTDKTLEVNKIYNVNISEPQVAGVCFTATKATTLLVKNGVYSKLVYSTDGTNWNSMTSSGATGDQSSYPITIAAGNKVYFKAYSSTTDNTDVKGTASVGAFFTNTTVATEPGELTVSGDIRYLLTQNPSSKTLSNNSAFQYLFTNNKALKDASKLVLPYETLSYQCYMGMFHSCINLTSAPSSLPATTLAVQCYALMFLNCSNLVNIPQILPATTLKEKCYQYMFKNCTLLSSEIVLPADTLVKACYQYMFAGCSNLSSVVIKATSGFDATPNPLYYWLGVDGSPSYPAAGASVSGTKTVHCMQNQQGNFVAGKPNYILPGGTVTWTVSQDAANY